jgi:hypothetical protein
MSELAHQASPTAAADLATSDLPPPDYLHLSKGFSVEVSTTIILLFGVGCAMGVVAGGTAGQALYNW